MPATDADGYISGAVACATFAILAPTLSKLCHPGGPIRYRRPTPRRLLVHAADLGRYLAKQIGAKDVPA
jgi:hypothetical protein